MRKLKECSNCNELKLIYKARTRDRGALCKECYFIISPPTPLKKGKIKQKVRKATGEYKLFQQIYEEVGGRCQITGERIDFDVNNFAHILSKGAYPSLRLERDNIIHVLPEIHHLYDNSDKQTLLTTYPDAEIIYKIKEKLKYRYYNGGEK